VSIEKLQLHALPIFLTHNANTTISISVNTSIFLDYFVIDVACSSLTLGQPGIVYVDCTK